MITSDVERKKKFIINFFYYAIIVILFVVFGKYIFPFLVPFLFGFCIAYALRKPINFLNTKVHINKKFAAIFCVILFYIFLSGIATLLVYLCYSGIESFIISIPNLYNNYAKELTLQITEQAKNLVELLGNNQDIVDFVNESSKQIITYIGKIISSISVGTAEIITGIATKVPGLLMKTVLMIISTFFIAIDYDKINNFVVNQMKPETSKMILEIKNYIFGTVFVCIKSYAIIMSITFIELMAGLSILGVKNAVIIAFLTSILDILPVLGTGAVVIPWGIISLVAGNLKMGIGLLILYVIITVIRNIIEPKIVGKELGLHPIITLVSMFVGVNLAGIIGLFGFPILISLILYLNREGIIKIFK